MGSGGNRSGGAPGTGGLVGTGGAATGGREAASGGAPGRGGAPSTGGANATGGARGTGGATATTPECQKFIDDYDAAMPEARMCKADEAKSCAMAVPAKLAGCGSGCTTYVNHSKMLESIQQKWNDKGCTATPCSVTVCTNLVGGTCSPVTGMCSDTGL